MDPQAAVLAIARIHREDGGLPQDLVEAYLWILAQARKDRPGLVEEFYVGLEEACPEALRYFPEEVKT
jgi:hypothetical protein